MTSFGEIMGYTSKAAADLRTHQYHLARATGAGTCNVASEAAGGANDLIGVLQNKPNTNQAAHIGVQGESKVVAGGSITANVWITTNGSGRAAAAVSGDNVVGLALEAAGGDGDRIRVYIFPVQPVLRT